MKSFDLYSHNEDSDLETVRRRAEKSLSLIFSAHASSYLGEYYKLGARGSENFVLQRNFNGLERAWAEPLFSQHSILLYVNETPRSDSLEKLLLSEGFVLLRRDNL